MPAASRERCGKRLSLSCLASVTIGYPMVTFRGPTFLQDLEARGRPFTPLDNDFRSSILLDASQTATVVEVRWLI